MKYRYFLFLLPLVLFACNESSNNQAESDEESLTETIDRTLQLAANQYEYLGEQIEPGEYPKTYYAEEDELETSGSGWWCSGFYPGTLLYLHESTGDPQLKDEAERVLEHLKREQFNTSTHDLGFMMYCSFGNAIKQEQNEEYEEILMNSANSLSTRYNETVGAIRSWDNASWNSGEEGDLVVIIDNMMNLELLFWATEHSQDSTYYDIAVDHANTTMDNHFRPDYSSFHELVYSESDGSVKSRVTNQGTADESAWARGQAWGLYGYVMTYRETMDEKYLEQAQNIADFILNHPNLPEDKIPYWDFDAPNIPDEYRDSSAGAIIASALLELSTFSEGEKGNFYFNNATDMLQSLLSPEYLAEEGENGGFLLKHAVGSLPGNSEVDVPLTYGDYYFVEAMRRYKDLN